MHSLQLAKPYQSVSFKVNTLSSILDNDVNNDIKLRPETVLGHISLLEYIVECLDAQGVQLTDATTKSIKSLLFYVLPVDASSAGSIPYLLSEIKSDIRDKSLPACFYYVISECCKIIIDSNPGLDRDSVSNINVRLDEVLEDIQ